MKYLSRISLKARFQLVSLFFITVALVPLLALLSDSVDLIRSTQSEVDGLLPTRSVLEAARLVQQHRGLSAAQLNGGQDAASPRADVARKLDAAMQKALADLKASGLGTAAIEGSCVTGEGRSAATGSAGRCAADQGA
jgi:hypothetical protein